MDATCLRLGAVFSYVTVVFQIYNPTADFLNGDPTDAVVGLNAAVTPSKRGCRPGEDKKGRYRLTAYQKK